MGVKQEKWDLEVDFISAGSGGGGITAAIVAHDLGKKAVILEKAPKLGGVTAYSAGDIFLPANHKMEEAGIADSIKEGRKYFDWLAAGFNDPALLDCMLDAAYKAVPYLEKECGVKWSFLKNFPDYYYPEAPGSAPQGRYLETELFKGAELGEWQEKTCLSPIFLKGYTFDDITVWGGLTAVTSWDFQKIAEGMAEDMRGFGPGLMGFMIKAAVIDRDIPAYVNTPVCELILEDGAVIGVKAQKDGEDFYIRARNGVLLSIGGYDFNEEMAKYYEDLPEWKSMAPPYVTGDNMILGGEVGAAVAGVPPSNLGMFFGYHIPGEEHEGKPMWRSSVEGVNPHALWVNKDGKRFCDETFYKDYSPKVMNYDGRANNQPNYPPFLIFDQNFCERYPVGTFMPGQDIPEKLAARADTLGELAQKLGIDADNFEATIERYNGLVEKGEDTDFGRGEYVWARTFHSDKNYPNPNMGVINKPPFYGIELKPCNVGINAVGLKINENAQVMHVRGVPIKGLYAAGNSAALIDVGSGYQSGVANTRGIAWGWVAAHHALEVKS
jgi:3-oxosteroid 1-dehydrogenase